MTSITLTLPGELGQWAQEAGLDLAEVLRAEVERRRQAARKDRPRDGIRTVALADGSKRYEIVVDAGRDPKTGRRQQTRRRYKLLREAKAELARIGHQTRTGEFVGAGSRAPAWARAASG
jgi:Arm DNA-binding domain